MNYDYLVNHRAVHFIDPRIPASLGNANRRCAQAVQELSQRLGQPVQPYASYEDPEPLFWLAEISAECRGPVQKAITKLMDSPQDTTRLFHACNLKARQEIAAGVRLPKFDLNEFGQEWFVEVLDTMGVDTTQLKLAPRVITEDSVPRGFEELPTHMKLFVHQAWRWLQAHQATVLVPVCTIKQTADTHMYMYMDSLRTERIRSTDFNQRKAS